jgi:hypothetical protein
MQIEFYSKQRCPITFGLPTKMTEKGFDRSCQEKQQDVVRSCKGSVSARKKNGICSICKGENKPAELEIFILEGIEGIVGEKQKITVLVSDKI